MAGCVTDEVTADIGRAAPFEMLLLEQFFVVKPSMSAITSLWLCMSIFLASSYGVDWCFSQNFMFITPYVFRCTAQAEMAHVCPSG